MIPFLLLLAVGVGQQPSNVTINCPHEGPCTTNPPLTFPAQTAPIGKSASVALLGPKIQPPDKPCDHKYEYEGMTMPDKPGFAGKVLCAPIMHPLKESEYQEIMERLRLVDLALRETICSNMNWKE